jgi:hypothetical protein
LLVDTDEQIAVCSGDVPIEVDGVMCDLAGLEYETGVTFSTPGNTWCRLRLQDPTGEYRRRWVESDLAYYDAKLKELVWHEGAWVVRINAPWKMRNGSYDQHGNFFIELFAGATWKPKVGLPIATRDCAYVRGYPDFCGYGGAEATCDGKAATCAARGHIEHFGGFELAPTPGQKLKLGGSEWTYVGGNPDPAPPPGGTNHVPPPIPGAGTGVVTVGGPSVGTVADAGLADDGSGGQTS